MSLGISLKERWITEELMKVKIWKKLLIHKHLVWNNLCFHTFHLKFSHYTVLEAKCVGNRKSEILWWAHHPVRVRKIVKFGVFRPLSLGMRGAHAPPPCLASPPPARPPPASTCPRLTTETHQTYQWEIGCLVDGVGESASLVHAPHYPYRLGINGTVWGFVLSLLKCINLFICTYSVA